MTELERHDPDRWREAAVSPVQPPLVPDGVAAIQVWAQTAQAASELVERLVDSPFVPDAFRPRLDPRATPDERHQARQIAVATATAAVLYGGEIGLSPMQALANVIVIKGKPGLYAETMVALVQAAGHEIWTEDVTDVRAIVCGRRAGSQQVERVVFTLDRAKKAGYTSQNSKYGTDPQSMLYARAASIACRRTAPEVLKGIPVVEELLDESDGSASVSVVRTAQRGTRRAAVRALPAPSAGAAPAVAAVEPPPLPGESGYDEPATTQPAPEPFAEGITKAQQGKLNATLKDLNVTDRDHRLRVASVILARAVESSSDLSKDEASVLIDTLSSIAGQDDGPLVLQHMLDEAEAEASGGIA